LPAALSARARVLDGTGRTRDGHQVPLLADIGKPEGATAAADCGAEGVGLFRTEFCYLARAQAPSIDEQVAQYRQAFAAFAGKRVVVRTLDAGADKPLPFLSNTDEPNPALGVRGLRTSWRNPRMLDDQLSAIAAAAAAETADVWVMAPMVSTVAETEDFENRCHVHGLTTAGVMVEVPSAALLAGPILAHTAFASIGTNDLTGTSWLPTACSPTWPGCLRHGRPRCCSWSPRPVGPGPLRAVRLGCAQTPHPIPRWPSCLSVSGSRPCRWRPAHCPTSPQRSRR